MCQNGQASSRAHKVMTKCGVANIFADSCMEDELTTKCSARVLIGSISVAAPKSTETVVVIVTPTETSTRTSVAIPRTSWMFKLAVVCTKSDT